MDKLKRLISSLLVLALIMSSLSFSSSPTFATEYYEYGTTNQAWVKSVYKTHSYSWKPLIQVTFGWNISQYSFTGEEGDFESTNRTSKTFYFREDYNDKTYDEESDTVRPLSTNVIFLYVKEKNSNVTKLLQYRLSSDQLSHLYYPKAVPNAIIQVTDMIDALPLLSNFDTRNQTHLNQYQVAWNAYNALSAYDKTYVFNYTKLYKIGQKIEQENISNIDWTKVYTEMVNLPGKLTEQYYDVSQYGLYNSVYLPPNKDIIFGTPIGNMRYNNATSSFNVMKDATSQSQNTFFEYNVYGKTGSSPSPSMAKKVWGYFIPPATGNFKFKIKSDDGHVFLMYLTNGSVVQSDIFNNLNQATNINTQFDLHGISVYPSENGTNNFYLYKDVPYPIYMEYFNHGGDAALVTYYQQNNSGAWVEMKGNVYKPSSAAIANSKPLIVSDLKIKTDAAKLLLDEYASKIINTGSLPVDGFVSKAAYDALKAVYDDANLKLTQSLNYTQEQINQATADLIKAIDTFNQAIYRKSQLINGFSTNQENTKLHIRFDKLSDITGYKIILTDQNIEASQSSAIITAGSQTNGRIFDLKNNVATLLPNETLKTFDFGGLPATLKAAEGKPNGVFDLYVELGAMASLNKIYTYVQSYNNSLGGEFVKEAEVVLKQPETFGYFFDQAAGTVTYVAPAVQGAKYVLEYVNAQGQVVRELSTVDSNIFTLTLNDINQAQITQAKLAIAEADAYSQKPDALSFGPWKTTPTVLVIPKVSDVKIKMMNGDYSLSWTALDKATSYVVYSGNTPDVTKMAKLKEGITGTSYQLTTEANVNKYYSVKAIFPTGVVKESVFSDVAHMELISEVNIKNVGTTPRKLIPDAKSYFVLLGNMNENGFYTVTVPSSVKLKAYTTSVVSGDATAAIKVSYPEKAGVNDESFTVKSTPMSIQTSEDTSLGLTTYKLVSPSNLASDYQLIKKDIVVELIADKHYDKVPKLGAMTVVKKITDSKMNLMGESAAKSIDLTIEPNEKEVAVTVKPGTGSQMEIKNNTAYTSINRQTLDYRFEFNKGDAYKPIFEFVLSENEYIELLTSGFKFSVGTIGQAGVLQKDVYYIVKPDPVNSNKRLIRVFFDQNTNFNGKFIEVGVNFEPKVSNISSDAQIYNVLSGQLMDVSKEALWNIPSFIASLLKPGVKLPAPGQQADPTDYLANGLGITTSIHYDDKQSSGLTGDTRLITEKDEELKIQLINRVKLKKSF